MVKCEISIGEICSRQQTSVDKTHDYVMTPERGALAGGSDPSERCIVYTFAGDIWRALIRRMTKQCLVGGGVEHKRQIVSIPVGWHEKTKICFRFGRRMQDAAGNVSSRRPQSHLPS